MKSPEVHLKKLYTPRAVPNCLLSYFSQISKLGYLQQPDYDSLRKSFLKELTDMKINPKKTSHLDWMLTSTPAKDKSQSFIEKSPGMTVYVHLIIYCRQMAKMFHNEY